MAYEASSATLSKKLSNGHHRTFTGTSVYDGLFASPLRKKLGAPATPNLPARAEDYREIFGGGSEASSIPFLDVPELNEEKVSVDVRASELDYSKVFGGGGDSSFVERFEEVPQEPNARKKSEGEWTRAGRVSPSEVSESSSSSEGNNVQSPASAHNAFSGGKKFNMSYNKINIGNGNGAIGINQTTHIAELNAVRGYACLIDQALDPLQRTESAKPVEAQSSPNWFKTYSLEKPTENYQFGVGARRSKLPSSSSLPHNFNFGKCDDREGSSSNSPTYFEEEVDTNSVAAISSAALRKAIEDAQAKIKVAKAIMEKKKAGLTNDGKLSAIDRLKPEERKEGSDYGLKKKKTNKLRDEVVNPLRASSKVAEVAEAEVFYDVENTIVDTPRVSAKTVNRNVTAPIQETEDTEVQNFVSDTIETDLGTSFYELKPSEADQAQPAEVAEQVHVFEEFTRVQSVDENAGKAEIIAEQVFEKPQQVVGENENLEEAEKTNKIQNGSIGDSESSKDGCEDTVAERVHVFREFTILQSVDENAGKAELIAEQVFEKPQQVDGEDEKPEEAEKTNKIQNGSIGDSDSSKDGGEPRMEEDVFYHENEQKKIFSITREESGEIVQGFDERDKCETSAIDFPEPFNTGKLPEIRWLNDYQKEENGKEHSHFHGLKYDTKRFSKRATWDRSMGPAIKEKLNGYCLGKEIAKILSHNNEPEGISKMPEAKVPQNEEYVNGQEESETSVRIRRKTWKGDYKDVMKTACDDKSEDQTPVIKILEGLTEADDSVDENYDEEKTDVLRIYGSSRVLELTKIGKPLEDKTESSSDKNGASDEVEIFENLVQRPRSEPDSQYEVVHESREHFENLEERIKESEVGISQEDEESKTQSILKQERVNSWTNMEESQGSSSFRREEQSAGLDEKSESGMSKEKDRDNPATVNGENDRATIPIKESFEKEVELKKTQQRILDEAKEREKKEIEKGRIAVERAVREARERAFADARERAAAGARQKVKAEARDRPVTTSSAEANAKSAADKARESKLKAERAAVERATVEARERALEKAMSRKQNLQHKGPSFTSTSRFPHSSNGVSNLVEKPDAAKSESVQRCKARSEREQRISERADKALAEKNTRDQVAQKEQAERNRIAETLDIEVKRWSTGKERNLRALLSTLQYILGPDSGWQPIPLTEMITIAAVKKAYRKATLSVHPDKLQQRGATIQQKYICEKVFDLLKEAWNKFNVEER